MKSRTILLISIGILVYFSLSVYHTRQVKKYPDNAAKTGEKTDWIQITTAGKNKDNSRPDPVSGSAKKDKITKQSELLEQNQSAVDGKFNILRQQLQTASEEKEKLQKKLEEERSLKKNLALKVNDLHARISHQQSQLQKINTQLQDRQQTLERALLTIEHLTGDNTSLKEQLQKQKVSGSQLDSLKMSLLGKTEAVATANDRIAALSVRSEQSAADLAEAQKTITLLQSLLAVSQSEKEQAVLNKLRYKDELSRSKTDNKKRLAETGSLQNKLKELKSLLAVSEARLNKAQLKAEAMFRYGQEQSGKLAPATQEIEMLKARLDEKNKLLQSTEQQLGVKQAELKSLASLQKQVEKDSRALAEAVQRIEELAGELQSKDDQLLQKEALIAELNTTRNEAQAQVKEIEKTSVAQATEITNLQQSLTGLYDEKNQLQALLDKTAREQAQITANNKEYRAQTGKVSQELQTLKEQQQKLLSQQENLQATLKKKEITIKKISGQLEQTRQSAKQLKHVQKELVSKNKALTEAEKKITQLNRRHEKAQNSLVKAEAAFKNLERSLQEANRDKTTLAAAHSEEIKQLKDSLEAKDKTIAQISDEISLRSNEMQKKSLELEKVRQENLNAAAPNSELEKKSNMPDQAGDQLQSAREEIKALKTELDQREQAFSSMRDEFSSLQAKYELLQKNREEKINQPD